MINKILHRLKYTLKDLLVVIYRLFLLFYNPKVIIAPVYSPHGGVTNHIKMIHKYSKQKTYIYLPNRILKLLKANNIKPHRFGDISKLRTKIIHSHVDSQTVKMAFEAQKKGKKWLHTYHSLYFEDQWEGRLQQWQRNINESALNIAKNADIKISVSKWLQKLLKEEYEIDTIYIPNGVNIEECKKANPNNFINKFGLSDFILFSGNLSDVKDPLMFIKLAQNNPDFLYVMIGSDLLKEKIEKKYKVKLSENIKTLGGLSRTDALNAVSACKMMICTSKSEGLPTAIMEAMIMKKTIIAPDSYGCKEVLNNGKCGYLYEPYNLQSLNEQFNKAIGDNEIGEKAKQFAEENYNWEKIVAEIDNIYNIIITKT